MAVHDLDLASRMYVEGASPVNAIYNGTNALAGEIRHIQLLFNNLELRYLNLSMREGFRRKEWYADCVVINDDLNRFIHERQEALTRVKAQMNVLKGAFDQLLPYVEEGEGENQIQQIKENLKVSDGLDEIVMPDGYFDIDEWFSSRSWMKRCQAIGCVAISCCTALLCSRKRLGMTKIEKLQRGIQEGM